MTFELRHPLAEPLQALFRAEHARIERLIEKVKLAIRELSPDVDAAWIEGAFATLQDRPGDPLEIGVLARGGALPGVMKALRMSLGPIEAGEDIRIELKGYTRPDLEVIRPDEARDLAKAIPISGTPPSAFTKLGRETQDLRNLVMHADRDRQQALIAEEVATRLVRNPGILQAAKEWIEKRLDAASARERAELEEWLSILNTSSPSRLARFLRDTGERATRLRQTFPFMEVLSPDERAAILQKARGL